MSEKPSDRPKHQPQHQDQQRERKPGADQPEPERAPVGAEVVPFPARRARIRREAQARKRLCVVISADDDGEWF